jgi:IclR family transcriptional regulator, acetate operon repressor
MEAARSPRNERQGRRREYDVAVLRKALDLLEALADGGQLGLTDLSRRGHVHKTSAYRILTTLERRGYVLKDGRHRTYAPGPKLIAVSAAFVSGLGLVQLARPVLEGVHAEFGETVNLGVLNDGRVLYIDMLESTQGLRMAARVGADDALHSTALGKAILVSMSPDELKQLLAGYNWERRTRRTITTIETLERELASVRQRGYAIDDEENEMGARCVGVPVRDRDGRPIAALSVSGPASRLRHSILRRIGKRLKAAAQEIERRMGREEPMGVRSHWHQGSGATGHA